MLLDSLRSRAAERPRRDDHARHPAAQPLPAAAGRALVDRHPEILDEPIEAPIVVVGMMRSGTTLLQRVLASDPRCTCACTAGRWASPRPASGWDPSARRPADRSTPRQRGADARPSPPSCSPSTPPTCTRPRRRSSSSPTPSCRTSPRRRATCPRTGPGSTPGLRPAYRVAAPDAPAAPVAEAPAGRAAAAVRPQDAATPRLPRHPAGRVPRRPHRARPPRPGRRDPVGRLAQHHAVADPRDDVDPTRSGASGSSGWAGPATGRWRSGRRSPPPGHRRRFRDAVADPIGTVERVLAAVGLEPTDEARDQMEAWLAQDPSGATRPPTATPPSDFGLTAARSASASPSTPSASLAAHR